MKDLTSYCIKINFIFWAFIIIENQVTQLNYPTIISLKLILEKENLSVFIYLLRWKDMFIPVFNLIHVKMMLGRICIL